MRATEFPLFFEGQETTRSSYAIFLLNKVGQPHMRLCNAKYNERNLIKKKT
jgi:hypothetical protein